MHAAAALGADSARSVHDPTQFNRGLSCSELISLVDPHVIVADALPAASSVRIRDVSIYDPAEPVEAGTMVLAVGVDIDSSAAQELVREAAHSGAAAVVFRTASRTGSFDDSEVSIFRAQPAFTWTQVMVLLRALVCLKTLGADSTALIANSMDGLADTVAAMVGGSVVVYDRAHEVIGYALLGHPIDEVRRESICGRRTPAQWVTRFTEDDSAYQTFQTPGTVVRIDGYDDLRTRLRVAVESNGEILGELSVAEGNSRLDARAEEALRIAAKLASPLMLRYKRSVEGDRVRQRELLLRVLNDSDAAVKHAPELGLRLRDKWLLIGFQLDPVDSTDEGTRGIINERAARLLSMQLTFVDTTPTVFYERQIFYVLLAASTNDIRNSLRGRLEATLDHLAKIGIVGYAAVGAISDDLRAVPAARADVDRLLKVGLQHYMPQSVLTIEDTWAERSMSNVCDALGADIERDCPPLAKLLKYDQEHSSDFVSTLAAYMDEFGSISAAAERLFIHQNTLRHRLHRIVEIAGIDFASPAQRLVVNCFLRQARKIAAHHE